MNVEDTSLTDGNIQRTGQRAKGQSEEVERWLDTPDPTRGLSLTTPHQDCKPSDKRNVGQYNQEPALEAVVSTDLQTQRGQRTLERTVVGIVCRPPSFNRGEKGKSIGSAPSTGNKPRKILTVKGVKKKLIFDEEESESEEDTDSACILQTVVTEQPNAVPIFQKDIAGKKVSEDRKAKEEDRSCRKQSKGTEDREENTSTDKGE